jgi:hypothetical protein
MKKNILVSVFAALILLLSGCDSVYQTKYIYELPQSQSGQTCVSQCQQTKNMCQEHCQSQDRSCRLASRQVAYYHYQHYHDARVAHGLPVDKNLNDFDNSYYKCNHTCHCSVSFNHCYKGCGGRITERKESA